MQVTHSIRITKNVKFHKTAINKLGIRKKKTTTLNTLITKQNIIAKISHRNQIFQKRIT